MLDQVQVKAIPLLFTTLTIPQIAAQLEVSEYTLQKWIRTSKEFREVLKSAQRYLVLATMRDVIETSRLAIRTLGEVLKDPSLAAGVRVSAAKTVLDHTHAAYLCSEEILTDDPESSTDLLTKAEGEVSRLCSEVRQLALPGPSPS